MSEKNQNRINNSNTNGFNTSVLRKALDSLGNIFAINVLFIVTSIPVFTIGASLTAAYSMSMRLQEDREETVFMGYLTEFRKNFKQATLSFIILLIASSIMMAEYLMIQILDKDLLITKIYIVLLVAEILVMAFVFPFLFPLIAAYENSLRLTFKNSIYMSVGYTWSAVKILLSWIAPIAICVFYPMIFYNFWYLWLLIIFGAIIWGTSYTVRKVFRINNKAYEERLKQEKK